MIYWDRWGPASTYGRVPYAVNRVTPPSSTPIDITELKLFARIDDEAEDGILYGFIDAATSKVERDSGIALLTQTWDVFFDEWQPTWAALLLPFRPVQSVTWIKTTGVTGVVTTWDAANYVLDAVSVPARIRLADAVTWPADLRLNQPWSIRVVVGHASVGDIDPLLIHAVGLLATHYAGPGRDLAGTPLLYEELMAPYRPMSVA